MEDVELYAHFLNRLFKMFKKWIFGRTFHLKRYWVWNWNYWGFKLLILSFLHLIVNYHLSPQWDVGLDQFIMRTILSSFINHVVRTIVLR
jgi:hypothetical protein